jgi:FkbM family methyltransferase
MVNPYLSVVVTTRNDDHGGDPLKRLQAFINCFDEQCRRTGLDAEVIIVEWNPPAERPSVGSLVRVPEPSFCAYRFITVPPAIHQRLRADGLPLFQMIAKNVGIRRARGHFVLATNIDIIFSTELIDFIASRRLQSGHLYRVDRHDIQADFPVDALLDEQMAYCASHQLRIHTRSGTDPVDSTGHPVCVAEDIADGRSVQIGAGWHVREGAAGSRTFRWASDPAELIIDPEAASLTDHALLDLDIESNPYDEHSWVEVLAVEGQRPLVRTRVSGRARVEVPLWKHEGGGTRRIELRVTDENPDSHRHLPAFERRDSLRYRVHSARVRPRPDRAMFEYPASAWSNANENSTLTLNRTTEGLVVSSDPRKLSYCLRYGPLRAPERSIYRFELTYALLQGGIIFQVLNGEGDAWLPASESSYHDSTSRFLEVIVELRENDMFWLMISNRRDGDGVSRFVVQRLEGSRDPGGVVLRPTGPSHSEAVPTATGGRRSRWRESLSAFTDRAAGAIAASLGERIRYRIVRAAPEFKSMEQALRASDQQLRELAPLRDLSDFDTFLRHHRPDNLHVNACGDFQLMVREHWDELRAYPEFKTFSMNIDGLFSHIAAAAGIQERVLDMPIYHLEHEVGSGWSPDGEALLRGRIAERGVTWLDATTVYIWAAYMRWLGRPMMFNAANWGFAAHTLPERTVPNRFRDADKNDWIHPHPVFERFRAYEGWAEPGFERGFYGVNIRDWVFTGESKGLTDRRFLRLEHPPMDDEYFEWIALLTAVTHAIGRFCFAEIGAGWGRWMASAAALCRQNAIDFALIGVEPEPSHFEWMKMVMRDNGVDPDEHELVCAAAAAERGELLLAGSDQSATEYGHRAIDEQMHAEWRKLPDLTFRPVASVTLDDLFAKHERIDLVDMDVQGAEHDIVAAGIDVLNSKVRMLHVGTHSREAEAGLTSVLRRHGWLNAFSFPSRSQTVTPFGRIRFDDGVQTWVSPRWPELHRALVDGVRPNSKSHVRNRR